VFDSNLLEKTVSGLVWFLKNKQSGINHGLNNDGLSQRGLSEATLANNDLKNWPIRSLLLPQAIHFLGMVPQAPNPFLSQLLLNNV
jgi:hypothetical protein